MGKQSNYKKIKRIAKHLPTVMQQTHEKHILTGVQLKEEGFDENEKQIIDNNQYERRFPVLIAVNHNRRMKKEYNKNGLKGVNNYVQAIKNKTNGKA